MVHTIGRKITVIGAGTMGLGISQLLSQHNHKVTLIDSNEAVLESSKSKILKRLSLLKEYECVSNTEVETAIKNITVSTNLKDSIDSWLVIEAVPEIKELKIKIFKQLESICDDTVIFATNTSGISINSIGNELNNPERFIGTHFFMPADIIPLVEVIKGEKTSETVSNQVLQFFKQIDKYPVLITMDIPGFIGNRIQHAMAREAISLLEKGVATAEEIDTVVRWSLGPRLLFTGPLEQRDLNGLDVHHHIASYLYEDLENSIVPAKLLSETVDKGNLGIKTGKGFYEWDENEQQTVNQRKSIEILKLIKMLTR